MENFDYPYHLEPSGSGRKYKICPGCGKPKFTVYVRTDTGDCIDPSVGRCERIHSCGYHLTPAQYFKENNIYSKNNKTMKNEQPILDLSQKAPEKQELWDATMEQSANQIPMGCIDESKLRKFRYGNSEPDYYTNALFVSLCSVFGYEKTMEAFKLYDIHTTTRYLVDRLSGSAFFYRDENSNLTQVKECAYNPNTGRRCKDGDEVFVRGRGGTYEARADGNKILHTEKYIMGDDFTPKQTLFGAHLLKLFPNKPRAGVESEKSALICSICDPSYVWLATGGMSSKINAFEVYDQLRSSDVTLFPDLGAMREWEVAAAKMSMAQVNVKIFDLSKAPFVAAEDINKGLDIADYFIEAYKLKYPNAGEDVRERLRVNKSEGSEQTQSMLSILSAQPCATKDLTADASTKEESKVPLVEPTPPIYPPIESNFNFDDI
ncbi:MAG: DUF6371 domain-containing protein [Mucinivorans sp.]